MRVSPMPRKNDVKTTAATQSARGDKNGKWTTVLAAAVLIT